MALVTISKDLYRPGARDGHVILVARAGTKVDELTVKRYGGEIAAHFAQPDAPTASDVVAKYDGMKPAALKKLAKERNIEGAEGLKAAELIDALEYDDESRGA